MRLTLRTLLAYLDDILEPAQAREIGEKLNESSFASSLVSRIREVMRRRRLTAPTLSGPGVGIDPNTVSEYLDNTLPPDGVADVEKICLESDVHLAEAAACHQILTLALGEPVEVSPQTRERMYALGPSGAKMTIAAPSTNGMSDQAVGDVLAQAHEAAPASHPRPVVRAVAATEKPEIPDYLRPRSSVKRVLAFVVVAAVMIGWGFMALNLNRLQDQSGASKIADDDKKPGENQADGATVDGASVVANGKLPDDASVPDQIDPDANADGASDQVAMVGKSGAGKSGIGKSGDSGKKKDPGIDLPPPDEPEEDTVPVAKKPTVLAGNKKPREGEPAADAAAGPTPSPPDNPESPQAASAPKPSKYISADGVTLHYVPREERWFRLPPPPRSMVHAGDYLAVPDPYQCALEIDGGQGLVTILGRSAVQVIASPQTGNFGLELNRGQFVVRPAGVAGDPASPLRIGVVIAGELWRVELTSGTTLGVRVDLLEPTKFEQALDKDAYFGAFYVAAGGNASIIDPAGKVHEIKGLDWLELPLLADADGKPARPRRLDELPKWMAPPSLSSTDQNYARLFERKFTLNEAVELSIPEVAADPIFKVSQMATECLGLIGADGPLLDILHRSVHEEARKAAISGLRLWLPRHPENRELLKAQLANKFPPDDADAIYRLLWGFDVDDARNKEISLKLIDWMDESLTPELAVRELAFYHVSRLTKKDFDYRAGNTAAKNKSSMKRWREHVKRDGALLPVQKPTPNPQ